MKTEEKRARFQRVAERRVNRALKALHLVGQCANRRVYEYTDDEVRDMFNAIENELRSAKQAYAGRANRPGFRFGREERRA